LRTGKLEKHEWEQLSTKVKNLEKHLFYWWYALAFYIYVQNQTTSFSARDPNYYCWLFAVNDSRREWQRGRKQRARNFYHFAKFKSLS
jgi:hypothetical protein